MIGDADIIAGVVHVRTELRRAYPSALGDLTRMRRTVPGSAELTWADWCWLPMAATAEYLRATGDVSDIAAVHALSLWRLDQVVLHLHPNAVLSATPVAGSVRTPLWRDLPIAPIRDLITTGLPTWCAYLVTPPVPELREQVHGMWVHLEDDSATGRAELRLLLDTAGTRAGLLPVVIYLDRDTLGQALDDMVATSTAAQAGAVNPDVTGVPSVLRPAMTRWVLPWLRLAVAACAPGYRFTDVDDPGRTLHRPEATTPLPWEVTAWWQVPTGPRPVRAPTGGSPAAPPPGGGTVTSAHR